MSILTTCFFLALIPNYAASITFNFTNITRSNSKDIILSGDAAYTNNDDGIQVTYKNINRSFEGLAGRATYVRPLHLWNNESSYLASFSTSFTFVIASYILNNNIHGDGLTFFLAQNNSVINAEGSMGLPFSYQTNTSLCPFVAVEFDTFGSDEWDPYGIGDHVGININSVTSVVSRLWSSGISSTEKEYGASISYDSDSKSLGVSFTSFRDNSAGWETGLNYTIDLSHILPEWVIFGFSASTGDGFEKNNVRSWTFNSTEFMGDENNGLTPTKSYQTGSLPPTKSNDESSSLLPAKSNDQSSNLSPTMSMNGGKYMGLIAGTLVLVFYYMALL